MTAFPAVPMLRHAPNAPSTPIGAFTLLREKHVFLGFDETLQRQLMKNTVVFHYPPHAPLFEWGDRSPHSIFLLQGDVQMNTRDGHEHAVSSDDTVAHFALADLKPRLYRAVSAAEGALLAWVNGRWLDNIAADDYDSILVEEVFL